MTLLDPADFEFQPVAVFLLIVVAAILQDDLACTTVGMFAWDNRIPLSMAWFACLVGTLIGDLIWFMLGQSCGRPLLSRAPMKWVIKPSQLERATAFMKQYGSLSLFMSRFLPGIRTSLHLVIGTLHKDLWSAVSVLALAALVYTLIVVGFCRVFRNMMNVLGIYEAYGPPALLIAAIAVLCVLWLGRRTIESFTRK